MEEYAAREARTVERPREGGGRRKLAERAYKFGWAEHVQEARGVNSRRRYASQARAANDTSANSSERVHGSVHRRPTLS